MRNFFELKLKGASIAFPVILGMVILSAVVIVYMLILRGFGSAPAVLDGAYFGSLFIDVVCSLFGGVINLAILFYVVKATVTAVSLNGESPTVDYNVKQYVGVCVKGLLLCAVTMGVYYPWFIVRVLRFFASGTSFRGNNFIFRGDGLMLFSYVALLLLLPVFFFVFLSAFSAVIGGAAMIMMLVLSVLLFLTSSFFYAMKGKWLANFSYGFKRIISTVNSCNFGLFIAGQLFLTVITIGFYYPMAILKIWQYYISHIVLGETMVEDKFGFTIIPNKNYRTILGQLLLTLITCGIYWPWAYAKVVNVFVSQTYVDVIEQPTENMPF